MVFKGFRSRPESTASELESRPTIHSSIFYFVHSFTCAPAFLATFVPSSYGPHQRPHMIPKPAMK